MAQPDDNEAPPSMLRAVLDDKIITAPNIITVSRLLLIPAFLYFLFSRENRGAAAAVLAVMGMTDWVDGQVARRYNQVSELGKILDPAADRILLIVAVVAIMIDGSVPLWVTVPVLVREPIMFVAVPVLSLMGAKRIDVTWYGKAGTFLLMLAFPLLLAGASTMEAADLFRILGYACAVPGLVLSYYAAFLYIPVARVAIREGRSERAAG
jgi:cardiolipin synthase